jgi:hypothetical protein
MLIGKIDLPKELLAAQEAGNLVVFAGAGVSMGPPANCPDFDGLVGQIGAGASVEREPGEPSERYLGRLESAGVPVHRLARDRLDDPASSPNELHKDLLRLFSTPETVRVVTTNFDRHFTTACADNHGNRVEIFKAPALPVGTRFAGIVYLHGSVEGPADRLVLTDRDFGRAYLTEGWARRFLLQVYGTYTVLFVGYSHNDTVMHYLTRGLPPGDSRLFAVVPDPDAPRWKHLGVTPIAYPLHRSGNKHADLHTSVAAWADYIAMGAFEHEERITRILANRPPVRDCEDDDYMKSVVADAQRHLVFCRLAKGKEWLLWAEEKGLLTPLFSRRTVADSRVSTLAWWFCRQGVVREHETALGIFRRQGQCLSQPLWYAIAQGFHAEKEPNPASLRKWLPILIDQTTQEDPTQFLDYLFAKAATAGSWPLALLLFEHQTRPHIKLEENYATAAKGGKPPDPTRTEIVIYGSHHWMKEAWEKIFKPNLGQTARGVLDICVYNIRRAYELETCHGSANDHWDPISFHRSAIEPNAQDDLHHAFDILIDGCRDSLEWLIFHERPIASGVLREWLKTPAPLLNRLAIHALRLDPGITPDDKLRCAIDAELLAKLSLHHEVFLLLRDAYPMASLSVRRLLLDHARQVTRTEIKETATDRPDVFWHGYFTLVTWLNRAAAGKCPLARTRLRRMSRKYPKFVVSDQPDFTHWSGGVREYVPESPVSVDQLLAMPIANVLELLDSYREAGMFGKTREGLLAALTSAAKQKPEWGVALARALPQDICRIRDAVAHVLWGWRAADLSDAQWQEVLQTMKDVPVLLAPDRDAAMLLQHGVTKEKAKIPDALMPLAEEVAGMLWAAAEASYAKPDRDPKDWLSSSINASGGQIAEFYITAISVRRKQAGDDWKNLPDDVKRQLDRIIDSRTYAGEMGRIILASQIPFLFACDQPWARRRVLPLLAWKRNKRQTVQAWDGFAHWGKWYDELLPDLLPLYEACFQRLDNDLTNVRKRFAEHIAAICLFSTREEVRGKWLSEFLQSVTATDRHEFAEAIRQLLWNMKPERAERAWRDWLDKYWKMRLDGKPVPLDANEANKMIEWAPHLGTVFPEVVQRIAETPFPPKVDQFIYHLLKEKGIHTAHPEATAEFLRLVVKASYETIADHGGLPEIIREVAKVPATHEALRTVVEHMAARGSPLAGELRQVITGRSPKNST